MLIALWIINALLALAMLASGAGKLLRTRSALVAAGMGWAADMSTPSVKAIGVLEVLAAPGLILPLLTGIAPILTPLAAVGTCVLMIGASVVHIRRHEAPIPAAVFAAVAAASAVLGFMVMTA